jgi:large repetitive protein
MVNGVVSDELGSTCPTGASNPSCSSFVMVLVPTLDIAVTANGATTTVPGAIVGYTVTIRNSGQTDYVATSVTTSLAEVLDKATYNADAGPAGSVGFANNNLTWTGSIAKGAIVTITYSVTVADLTVRNKVLTTSVTSPAVGSTCSDLSPCVNTLTVLIPGLTVSTSPNGVPVATATPGDQVVFTITVANTGETDYTGTVVSTSLSAILDDASFDGTINASGGVATYTAPNLSWTGHLHLGDVVTITYAVTVRNPVSGDKAMSMTAISSEAGSTCPDASGNPACTATVTVLVPALTIVSSVFPETRTPGSVFVYTVTVHNTGETAYDDLAITLDPAGALDDATFTGIPTMSSGGLNGDGTSWVLDLDVNEIATGTITMRVNDPDTGDKSILITAVSNAPGSPCRAGSPAPACNAVVSVFVPGLTITKSASTTSVVAGSPVLYTITVANTGETAYAPALFTDSLTGVLDDATYAIAAVASTGDVELTGSTLTWTGDLALGATAIITYSVTTKFPATGDRTLTNTVASSSPGANCLPAGTDPGCTSTVTVLVPALTVTKTADTLEVVDSGTVHYNITAKNTGEADYTAAVLTDSLVDVLGDATYDENAAANAGNVGFAGQTLTWTGDLVIGATVTITYSVTTNLALSGDDLMTNRVVSTAVGSTCTLGTETLCATTTSVVDRSITLSGLTPSFTLTGLPNSTVRQDGGVTMMVTTNSPGGYLVTVQAAADVLTGATSGNLDTIPIENLGVRDSESQLPGFQVMSDAASNTVHDNDRASEPGGDVVSNDFQIDIPFVAADTYSATLDYIAAAQ